MILQDQGPAPALGETLFERIIRYLNYPFIKQEGAFKLSIISVILLVLVICIAALISRYTRRFLQNRVLPRFHIDLGLQYTLLRLVHYVIITLGVLYALKIGFSVDLTSVAVILGFLSVGIGFGLQYIAADMASGFILLFERPVRVGDRVRLDDGIEGRVNNISLRSTVIVTNEKHDGDNAEFEARPNQTGELFPHYECAVEHPGRRRLWERPRESVRRPARSGEVGRGSVDRARAPSSFRRFWRFISQL